MSFQILAKIHSLMLSLAPTTGNQQVPSKGVHTIQTHGGMHLNRSMEASWESCESQTSVSYTHLTLLAIDCSAAERGVSF